MVEKIVKIVIVVTVTVSLIFYVTAWSELVITSVPKTSGISTRTATYPFLFYVGWFIGKKAHKFCVKWINNEIDLLG